MEYGIRSWSLGASPDRVLFRGGPRSRPMVEFPLVSITERAIARMQGGSPHRQD